MSFGFSPLNTVLYALPQQAIGFFFLLVPGNIVNIFPRARFPFVILITAFCCACLLSVGLMKGTADNKWTRWALFSFCSTYSCAMYLTWPLMSINVAGRTKKTWISGTALMTFCIGNIIGSQIFRPSDAPRYLKGLTGCAIAMAVCMVVVGAWWSYYEYTNRKRDRDFVTSGLTKEEQDYQRKLAGETDLTDIQVSATMCIAQLTSAERPLPLHQLRCHEDGGGGRRFGVFGEGFGNGSSVAQS